MSSNKNGWDFAYEAAQAVVHVCFYCLIGWIFWLFLH